MRDSPIAIRYDHNPVISMRCYRRGDHMAPPELAVSGGQACNRPVTLPTFVVREATMVLLARTFQVLYYSCPAPFIAHHS
jgi:hypothetical protein